MKSASRLVPAALVLAALLRLLFIVLPAVPIKAKAIDSIGDAREYVALAGNLAHSHTFTRDSVPPFRPELFRTPGYPLFLALPLATLGNSLVWPLLLQLLLSLSVVWMARSLALELGLAPAPAGLAALLVALSPNLAFLSSRLVSETLFTALLIVCLILFNRYRKHGRAVDLVGTGIGFGLLVLTRPIATFFAPLIALYVLGRAAQAGKWSAGLGHAALLLACASVVVTPWVIRNGVQTGRYIISTASDHNTYLYTAATVVAAERGVSLVEARDSMMAEALRQHPGLDSNDEASYWRVLAGIGMGHIRQRPLLALKVAAAGCLGSFILPISVGPLIVHATGSPDVPGRSNAFQQVIGLAARGRLGQAVVAAHEARLRGLPILAALVLAAALAFNLLLLTCALVALFLGRNRGLLWLLLPVLYFTLAAGTVGDARFRAPVEPLLAILAAAALVRPKRKSA